MSGWRHLKNRGEASKAQALRWEARERLREEKKAKRAEAGTRWAKSNGTKEEKDGKA